MKYRRVYILSALYVVAVMGLLALATSTYAVTICPHIVDADGSRPPCRTWNPPPIPSWPAFSVPISSSDPQPADPTRQFHLPTMHGRYVYKESY